MEQFVPVKPVFDRDTIIGIAKHWARKPHAMTSIVETHQRLRGAQDWLETELSVEFRGFIQRLRGYEVGISADIDQNVNICSNHPDAIATFWVKVFPSSPQPDPFSVFHQASPKARGKSNRKPLYSVTILLSCEHESEIEEFKHEVVDRLQAVNSRRYADPDLDSEKSTILTAAMSVTAAGHQAMQELRDGDRTMKTSEVFLGRPELGGQGVYLWVFEDSRSANRAMDRYVSPMSFFNFVDQATFEWATAYQQHSPKAVRVFAIQLGQYYAWHHLKLPLRQIYELLGQKIGRGSDLLSDKDLTPTAETIVATIELEELPFNKERLKRLLEHEVPELESKYSHLLDQD